MQLSVYIGNLGPDIVEGVLYEKFSPIGPISSLRICRDTITRLSLGYACVNFINPDHAQTAVASFDNELLNGRPMRVVPVSKAALKVSFEPLSVSKKK